MNAAAIGVANAFSPSRNACMIRTAVGRYRNDPYRASVIPLSALMNCVSPLKESSATNLNMQQASPAKLSSKLASPKVIRKMNQKVVTPIVEKQAAPLQQEVPATEAALAVAGAAPRYAAVKFKFETCVFIAPFRIAVGDHVIVEGDRGENMGCVTSVMTEKPNFPVNCKIVRRATAAEKQTIPMLRAKEAVAARSAQSLADTSGLNLKIVDSEFQVDQNKLTIYFSSKSPHIDFRKLQRGLFREFRCRIWIVNWAEVEFSIEMNNA